jgi:hypothetical protein
LHGVQDTVEVALKAANDGLLVTGHKGFPVVQEEALAELDGQEEWVLHLISDVGGSEVVDQSGRVVLDFLLLAVAGPAGLLLREVLLDVVDLEGLEVRVDFSELHQEKRTFTSSFCRTDLRESTKIGDEMRLSRMRICGLSSSVRRVYTMSKRWKPEP